MVCCSLLMYVFLFGFDLQPLMGRVLATTPSGGARGAGRAGRDPRPRVALLQHTCSTCPESVRDEAEQLRADFNSRIKQVLFHSMLCAYYTAYVPLCFTQVGLTREYIPLRWITLHTPLLHTGGSHCVPLGSHYVPLCFTQVGLTVYPSGGSHCVPLWWVTLRTHQVGHTSYPSGGSRCVRTPLLHPGRSHCVIPLYRSSTFGGMYMCTASAYC